ncbi:PREDICTED: microfibrillar-associated protein 2 isoform X4 [Hipposideros armiger]|uniref:Microfibrillar-associated protein 2 isoform X4 n=1 Tax=Hipposideros armiger TaxID=186990 RepID=A0A8B7SAQ4_HIPAR|nr:PREDICTED: microfibrillar-associated protein 2 isoform X4 [Hipposideros armiger]
MRAAYLFLLFLPAGLLAQGQYDLDPLPPFPDHVQYTHYSDQIDNPDYYDYQEATPRPSEEQFQFQSQQQVQQEVIPAPTFEPGNADTEPTEPGPLGKSFPDSWRNKHGPGSWGGVECSPGSTETAKSFALAGLPRGAVPLHPPLLHTQAL